MSISGGVSGEDAGGYKCVLSDSADFQTTSRSIDALVSVIYRVFDFAELDVNCEIRRQDLRSATKI